MASFTHIQLITEGTQAGGSSANTKWPARCFSWDWDSVFSDKVLHEGKNSKIDTLFTWLDMDPHLGASGDLANRATMMQICLGMGILLGDARLIQFTEDEYDDDVPGHITTSFWAASEYDKFQNYICKVREDLTKDIESSRYVRLVVTQNLLSLMQPYDSRKKRKASTGEPSRPKTKAQKVSTKHLPSDAGDESEGGNKDAESDHDTGYVSLSLAEVGSQLDLTFSGLVNQLITRRYQGDIGIPRWHKLVKASRRQTRGIVRELQGE